MRDRPDRQSWTRRARQIEDMFLKPRGIKLAGPVLFGPDDAPSYAREALGIDNTGAPLGGLTVERFKFARARLVKRGLLCRDHRGRYRPSAMHGDIW